MEENKKVEEQEVVFEEMEKAEEFGDAQDYLTGLGIGLGIVVGIVALT